MACKQDRRVRVGRRGEEIAANFLSGHGHTVLAKNWRSGHLEIDIVTMAADGIHFVEVKSRVFPMAAEPEASVGYAKRKNISAAAARGIRESGMQDVEYRFDVVSVVFDGGEYRVDYFPEAFYPVSGGGFL